MWERKRFFERARNHFLRLAGPANEIGESEFVTNVTSLMNYIHMIDHWLRMSELPLLWPSLRSLYVRFFRKSLNYRLRMSHGDNERKVDFRFYMNVDTLSSILAKKLLFFEMKKTSFWKYKFFENEYFLKLR